IKLSERFSNFELDVFQIMPNHIHGLIVLVGGTVGVTVGATVGETVGATVGATPAVAKNENDAGPRNNMARQNENDAVAQNNMARQNDGDSDIGAGASPAATVGTVGDIVGAYKSLVANGCLNIYKFRNEIMGKLWQRNYYEHIIKNERSYQSISNYIINNPVKWNADKFYP